MVNKKVRKRFKKLEREYETAPSQRKKEIEKEAYPLFEEIEKKRGKCYDYRVVDACLRLFREKGFEYKPVENRLI